jgi:hypothetical protein
MFVLSSHITLGERLKPFAFCQELTITSGWKQRTDTLALSLPRNLRLRRQNLQQAVRRGDPCRIQLGYDGHLRTVFDGYITAVKPGIPMQYEAEDQMYLLKQQRFNLAFRHTTVRQLLEAMLPQGIPLQVPDIPLGRFSVNQATPAQILEVLYADFGLPSFFRNGTLYVGLAYVPSLQNTRPHLLDFQHNIISSNLEYRIKADRRLKIRAISLYPNNTKLEIQLGDPDGEEHTLHFYDLPESTLRQQAAATMDKLHYDGYAGDLELFGLPYINHGDIVRLRDNAYPEREGNYLVDEVERTFGVNGYRQRIKLGPKAN